MGFVEPILVFFGSVWWIAPAVVGAGAVSYGALTTGRRRARRLELDAARHEETRAYKALVAAKAQVRSAHADLLAAKAQSRASGRQALIDAVLPSDPGTVDAHRRLQAAKQDERSASLALRASRTRIKASYAEYRASSSRDPLPLARLMAEHDAIATRFVAYETDPELAIAYPQMTDARHPATLAFLQALRDAGSHRPSSAQAKVSPPQFLDYRQAVRHLAVAFDEAERAAGAAPRQPVVLGGWTIPEWLGVVRPNTGRPTG
ncbi:hypothetical protein GCM10010460_15000 [Microbacterium terrae]|uniref:Uncharacterized protein n=1 Tax=Microbacterium terrae TaxID=69369 RepID=A0A0M2H413_9MICO|nr:hypothetical protein RS81_02804 [Microbacterium terrae]GLJ98227.1 hypothetical protein GCM10017594_14240 [Microbacterium terrae]